MPTARGSWRRVGKAEVDMEVDAEVVEEKLEDEEEREEEETTVIKSWGSQKRGSRSRSSMGRNDLWIYCDYKPWLLQHLEDHPADRNWVISCYDHMTTTRLLIHMYNVYIYIYIYTLIYIYIYYIICGITPRNGKQIGLVTTYKVGRPPSER